MRPLSYKPGQKRGQSGNMANSNARGGSKRSSRLGDTMHYKQLQTKQIAFVGKQPEHDNRHPRLFRGLVPLSSSNLHADVELNSKDSLTMRGD